MGLTLNKDIPVDLGCLDYMDQEVMVFVFRFTEDPGLCIKGLYMS